MSRSRTTASGVTAFALLGALVAALACSVPSAAMAQQQEPAAEEEEEDETPAESRSADFKAVEGAPPGQDVPGGPLLVAAYGAAWLLLLLFVVRLGRLHGKTMRDVERLERTLDRKDGEGDGS